MKTTTTLVALVAGLGASPVFADPGALRFSDPQRLQAAGEWVKVESPGYAFPAWFDATGDGRDDLVVGQFRDGKMRVFPRQEDGSFGAGTWLMAEGKPAEVPGVW